MQLPPNIVPVLESVRALRHLRGIPLEFWQHGNRRTVVDAFMALASALMQSDLREEDVPHGYVVLAFLFDWEAACQSDGWGAFGNIAPADFERVCGCFAEVGLPEEAASLRHQMAAYFADPGDLAALNAAAAVHRHPLSGDLDRLDYLADYFREHAAELLYLPT
jgi:hypothetical protein